MNAIKKLLTNIVKITFLATALLLSPSLMYAHGEGEGHGGGEHFGHGGGGWHGQGKWHEHGHWNHGGVRVFNWSPWVIINPNQYYDSNCVKRCYWRHGQRICQIRCPQY